MRGEHRPTSGATQGHGIQFHFTKTSRTPPYPIVAKNFAGDAAMLTSDAGAGWKAAARIGDFVVEAEEVQRLCTRYGCKLPTCGRGLVTLTQTIVKRLGR